VSTSSTHPRTHCHQHYGIIRTPFANTGCGNWPVERAPDSSFSAQKSDSVIIGRSAAALTVQACAFYGKLLEKKPKIANDGPFSINEIQRNRYVRSVRVEMPRRHFFKLFDHN
jgi:hypothetical protein